MKLLSVKELQQNLSIGRDKAYDLMRNPAFPSVRIGGTYRVSEEALWEWYRHYQGKEFKMASGGRR